MKNTRSTRKQPFCWQEKKILRLLKILFKGAELQKYRNLYLSLTEIDSDFNGKTIKYYTETIAKYSGLSKAWIPKGLKMFEDLKIILLVEEKDNGRFKGKSLVFTPENIDEMDAPTVKLKSSNGISVNGFLLTSEDIYLLEDNKRIEDINNTHTEEIGKKAIEEKEKSVKNALLQKGERKTVEKKEKGTSDTHTGLEKQEKKAAEKTEEKKENIADIPVVIQDILKKYKDLGLPDFKYPPENYVVLGVYRELGIAKLFEALTLMSQSEFVKNNMSVNAIFKIENLKKALNGNFKDKANRAKNISENRKEFERPAYENTTGDFIKDLLNGINGGK